MGPDLPRPTWVELPGDLPGLGAGEALGATASARPGAWPRLSGAPCACARPRLPWRAVIWPGIAVLQFLVS